MSSIYKKARSKLSSSARAGESENTLNSSTASLQSDASSSVTGSRPSLRSLSIRRKSRKKANGSETSLVEKSAPAKAKSGANSKPKKTQRTKLTESSSSSVTRKTSDDVKAPASSKKEEVEAEVAPATEEEPSQEPTTATVENTDEQEGIPESPVLESDKLLPDSDSKVDTISQIPTAVGEAPSETHEEEPVAEQTNESSVDETSPLLQNSRHEEAQTAHTESVVVAPSLLWSFLLIFKRFFVYLGIRNSNTALYVVGGLFVVFILGYLLILKSDKVIQQAITVSFQSVKVSNIDDEGFDSQIIASLYVNYDKVRNIIDKSFLKVATLLVGTVSISPNNPIRLYLSVESANTAPLHLVDLKLPKLEMGLINHRLTEVKFDSRTDLKKENIVEFINTFNDVESESAILNFQGVFNSHLSGSFFSFNSKEVNIYEKFEVSKSQFLPNLSLNDFELKSTNDSIDFSSALELPNRTPVLVDIPQIYWSLSVESCSDKLIDVGEWKTSSFKLEPHVPIKLYLNAKVKEIDNQLTRMCDGKDMSPLNIMIKNYLEEHPLKFFVRASTTQESSLPKWMLYILQNANYKIELTLPKQTLGVKNYFIDSFGIDIPSVHSNDDTNPLVINANSNFSLSLDNQINMGFEIPTFTTLLAIKNKRGETLVSGSTDIGNSVHAYGKNGDMVYDVDVNSIQMNVQDPSNVGKILNAIFNKNSLQSLYMDMELNDVVFDLFIFSSKLNHITLTDYELPLESLSSLDPIDYILNKLNISVESLVYDEATETSLKFSIILEDVNPTNYSFDVPSDPIGVDVKFNDTTIAHLKTRDVYIPANSDYKVIVDLEIVAPTVEQKPILESFVSRFVSNESPIEVALDNFQSERNPNLNKLLDQITLESVVLPQLNFKVHEKPKPDPNPEIASHTGSPFLVSTTFHVISSEIEVSIYNPIANSDVIVNLHQAESRYNGELLGHTTHSQKFILPPGIFKSPRIPIKISQGIGKEILRGALNGQLNVDVLASFSFVLDSFDLELVYNGEGITSDIKL